MSDFVQASPVSSFLGAYEQGQQQQHQRAIEVAQQIAAQHQQEMADAQQKAQAANQLYGHIVTGLGLGYTGDEVTKQAQPFADAAGITLPDLSGQQGAPEKEANRLSREKDKQLDRDAKQKLAEFKASIWQSIVDKKLGNADQLKSLQLSLDRASDLPTAQKLYVGFLTTLGQPGATQTAAPVGQQPVDPLAATATAPPQAAAPADVMLGGDTPTPGSEVNPEVIAAFAGQPGPTPDPLVQAQQAGAGIAPMPPQQFGGIIGARMDRMKAQTVAQQKLADYRTAMLELNRQLGEKKMAHYADEEAYTHWKMIHESNKVAFDQQFKTDKENFDKSITRQKVAIQQAQLNLNRDAQDTRAAGQLRSSQTALTNQRGQMDRLLNTMDQQVKRANAESAAVKSILQMQPPAPPGDDADTRTKQQYNQAVQQYNFKVNAAKDRAEQIPVELGDLKAHQQEIMGQKAAVQKMIDATGQPGKSSAMPDLNAAPVTVPGKLKGALPGMPGQPNGSLAPGKTPAPPILRSADIAGKTQAQLSQIRKDIQAGKIKFVP